MLNINLMGQELVHEDPYDISKINISSFLFMRPFGAGTAGPQLKISYYPVSRFMITYNGHFGLIADGVFESGPAGNKRFLQQVLEADLHIIDHSQERDVYVYVPEEAADTSMGNSAYTTFGSTVRHVFGFTGAIQYVQNRERLTKIKEDKAGTSRTEVIDLKTGRDTFISSSVSTNTFYTNLTLGFKYKYISATTVKYKSGDSHNDRHLEAALSLMLPIAFDYHRDLYHHFFSQSPTHRLPDYTARPGFMIGFYQRNSIRNHWTFGLEFGIQPTISPIYLKGTFVNLSLGYSVNL